MTLFIRTSKLKKNTDTVLTAFMTVLCQTIKAAIATPVKSLRAE